MSGNGGDKKTKRNLPSWMSSREDTESHEEKSEHGESSSNANKSPQKRSREDTTAIRQNAKDSKNTGFSNLLDGVVFVLSGFVNPERGTLRSQALEMGAEYRPDWTSDCTLLVCAFSNTPKFRQVEAQCGTIVAKEWITECYTQKKLVEIDGYLMHAGKPWRKGKISHVGNHVNSDNEASPPQISQKPDKEKPCQQQVKSAMSRACEGESSNCVDDKLSPAKVKKWAADDLKKTMAWLESQEEKPGADELKTIAAEGVLTCLQDAVDLLEQKQDLRQLTDQWNFIPRVVEELIRTGSNGKTLISDVHKQAMSLKKIYVDAFKELKDDFSAKGNMKNANEGEKNKGRRCKASDRTDYDSDETVEMTEEEIDIAFRSIASRKP